MGRGIQVLVRGQIIVVHNFAMNTTNFFDASDNFKTSDYLDWLANGVNHSHPDFGGPGCYTFRSSRQWVAETMGALALTLSLTVWALKNSGNASSGEKHLQASSQQNVVAKVPSGWRQAGLVAHTLIMGLAIGYKFSTRTLICLLQPCHMVTAVQVYLLAAPASSTTSTIFRTHLGLLNGAVLALLFPVTDAYNLPGEYSLYWIQHVAMLLVPFLLSAQGRPYTPPSISSVTWPVLSYCVFFLFHILVLQPVAFALHVNLDYVLCPAPSDPFYGPHYLLHHVWSQAIVVTAVSKAFSFLLFREEEKQKSC